MKRLETAAMRTRNSQNKIGTGTVGRLLRRSGRGAERRKHSWMSCLLMNGEYALAAVTAVGSAHGDQVLDEGMASWLIVQVFGCAVCRVVRH